MYGHFSPEMKEMVKPYIQGKHVWDLGCGTMVHAMWCCQNKASLVTAIDKSAPALIPVEEKLFFIHQPFSQVKVPGHIDVAWVSWPANYYCPGLLSLLKVASTIVYIGSNLNGNACGTLELFRHFCQRPILEHVQDYSNSFVIYGESANKSREEGLWEEYAAVWNRLEIQDFYDHARDIRPWSDWEKFSHMASAAF